MPRTSFSDRSKTRLRQQLDQQFDRIRKAQDSMGRPPRGWIWTVRDALGMSTTELAHRMGISQPTVVNLERSEVSDSIKLTSLQRAADALGCDLVYALVPRGNLEQAVREQARRKSAGAGASESDIARLPQKAGEGLIDRRGLWTEA